MAETRASEAVVKNHTEQMAEIRAQHAALKLQNDQILEELKELKSLLRGGSVQPAEERNRDLSMVETLETDPPQFNLRANDKQVRESVAKIEERSRTGTLHDYDEPFESLLMNGWVTEELAVNLFMGGLTLAIQHPVSIFRPQTLEVSSAIARLQESIRSSSPSTFPCKTTFQRSTDRASLEPQKESSTLDFPNKEYREDDNSFFDSEDRNEEQPQIVVSATQLCFLPKNKDVPEWDVIDLKSFKEESGVEVYSNEVSESSTVENFEVVSPKTHVRKVSGEKPKELRIITPIQANLTLWPFKVVVDPGDKYVKDGESDKEKQMVAYGFQKEPKSDSSDKEHRDISHMCQLLPSCYVRVGAYQINNWFSTDGELAPMLVLAGQRKQDYFFVVDDAHRKNGGLIACSKRRKQLMLSRGRITMFFPVTPILHVVAAHAPVTVVRKEAWCRRKKRVKGLHAGRFLSDTFEYTSLIARRLKPP